MKFFKNTKRLIPVIGLVCLALIIFLNASPVYAIKLFEGTDFIGGSETDPRTIAEIAIKTALGVIGTATLVFLIYGGALFLLARGDKNYIEKSKNVIIWAAIGLLLVFGAYAGLSYLFIALTS